MKMNLKRRSTMTIRHKILLIISTLLLASTCFGDIIYVDDGAPPGGDGLSWGTAYSYLQDGLAVAASGDEIRVAAGVYKPDQGAGVTLGDRSATFQLVNGVTLRGGYGGETILSGDLAGNDGPGEWEDYGENSYHVVTADGTNNSAILDGVTVTAGSGGDETDPWPTRSAGGGLIARSGNPIVTNCVFLRNRTAWYGWGGGMSIFGNHVYHSARDPVITNCDFIGNLAGVGGGLYVNASNPLVSNCIFTGNVGISDGGGIASHGSLVLRNCILTENRAGPGTGGGVAIYCLGGGRIEITNSLIASNSILDKAGGLLVSGENPTTAAITNCTLCANQAGGIGDGMTVGNIDATVTNCIFWNGGEEIAPSSGTVLQVTYSDVQGGWPGVGNIAVPPLFVDASGDDYHLLPGSPCIDAGTNTPVGGLPAMDLEGNPRPQDGDGDCLAVADMGAYEAYGTAIIEATIDIDPDTLNLSSNDKWVTCYIELRESCDVMDIDGSTVVLNGIAAYIGKEGWARVGANTSNIMDHDEDGIPERMVKFNASAVQAWLIDLGLLGNVELMVSGELVNGTRFEGIDVIRVINQGNKK